MTEKEVRHIEQLMLEKLTGVINKADAAYLENLLQNNEKIRLKWAIEEADFKDETQHYLKNIDEKEAWKQIEKGISLKRSYRKRRARRVWVAAAILLPLIFVSFYLFKNPRLHNEQPQKSRANNIQLTIGGAHTINLSQFKPSKNVPFLKYVQLKVRKGNLSYASLNNQVNTSLNTLSIPETKTYSITLSDGTRVTLNSVSSLKFPFVFSNDTREVWLQGEAFFDIAQNEKAPFIVHTPLTTIQVLGTSFNVNTYDSTIVKTALLTGSLRTKTADKSIKLRPGFESIFSVDEGFKTTSFDPNHTLSWMQGVYYFEDAPLEKIAPVIHRWFGKNMIFDDPEASGSRFTGALLKNKQVDEFLKNLSLTSNIHYYLQNDTIHIGSHEK